MLSCSEDRSTYFMCGSMSKPKCSQKVSHRDHLSLLISLSTFTPHHHTYLTWSLVAVPASWGIFHTVLTTIEVHFVPLAWAQYTALDPQE